MLPTPDASMLLAAIALPSGAHERDRLLFSPTVSRRGGAPGADAGMR
jgi:hypothetical protein